MAMQFGQEIAGIGLRVKGPAQLQVGARLVNLSPPHISGPQVHVHCAPHIGGAADLLQRLQRPW